MSSSLTDPLYERLLRSFPADQDYTRADWDDSMPDPVRHFLLQLLRHHSRREARRLRRARTAWVDYDHPEMEQAVQSFFNMLERHTRVPQDEWADTLHQATYHTTAHLVQPVDVLTEFVFGEREKPLRLPEVLWRMNFFGSYGYLREAVHAFAKKRDLDAFRPDQFESFLYRIDERITSDFDADRWLRLLAPLFSVARRATDREAVAVPLLRTFFEEKNATAIARRLTTYGQEGHNAVPPKVLHRLIEEAEAQPTEPKSATPPTTDAPPEPEWSPPTQATSDDDIWGVAGTARPAEETSTPAPGEEQNEEAPLWKQFQQGRTGSTSSTSGGTNDQSGQPLWAQFRQGQDSLAARLGAGESPSPSNSPSSSQSRGSSKRESTPFSQPEPQPRSGPSLETLEREVIGTSNPPHRGVYVRQLFNGDQDAYYQVLSRLRTADSWGEASQIIASDIFRTYKVNIYSDAAVHFTNAVESSFRT